MLRKDFISSEHTYTLIYLEKAALLMCMSISEYIKRILIRCVYLTNHASRKLVLHGYDVHVQR